MITKLYSSEYFSAKDTLTCGQVFRFIETGENEYRVISGRKACTLSDTKDGVLLSCDERDLAYFENYFDIGRDYGDIVRKLSAFPELSESVSVCKGVHILKQDFEETVFSFIVSANNNIKRIQAIIEKICAACGENMGEYYSFPAAESIQSLSIADLKAMGLGYRAEYIYDTARMFPLVRDSFTPNSEDVYKKLTALKGVGPKVANCIMLFGMNITDSYPVDTWIFKANKTEELDTPAKVCKYYTDRYGSYAGFAQQYIFHYERNYKK